MFIHCGTQPTDGMTPKAVLIPAFRFKTGIYTYTLFGANSALYTVFRNSYLSSFPAAGHVAILRYQKLLKTKWRLSSL
jgi:hypothetical protein